MNKYLCTAFWIFGMLITSCSNTRFLADDQLLYNGRQEVKITSGDKGTSDKAAEMHIKSVTSHKVNNALFERRVLPPIGLWVYNYWKADEEKKLSYWMYKNLVGQPILISDVNPELRVKKIQNDLFDQGYFQTRVWSSIDTSKNNPKKARISYFVELPPTPTTPHPPLQPPPTP